MKTKLLKVIKIIVLFVVGFSVAIISSIGSSVGVYAIEIVKTDSGVIYVQYAKNFNYESCLKDDLAPEYAGVDADGVGYLFGGWYAKKSNTYTAIKNTDELNAAKEDTAVTIVAKFVPAQTLSVKCQNWAGTNAESDGVIVRVISAVDSINYSGYGFVISKIVDSTETTLGVYTSKDSNEVYSKFNYYESDTDDTPDIYEPSDLFGNSAKHFISCTVGKIPVGSHGTIICIKPFWDTLDGVRVYGLSKFAHVEDGYKGYVNVPVNLNILSKTNDAAAGYLNVKCESAGLTFVGAESGVEYGKVFDEMEFHVADDGTIRCVGNTSDVANRTEKDIYINLKFQRNVITDKPEKDVFYKFSVTNEIFCDSEENYIPSEEANVWNIKY